VHLTALARLCLFTLKCAFRRLGNLGSAPLAHIWEEDVTLIEELEP
jgi:hypothetical protein